MICTARIVPAAFGAFLGALVFGPTQQLGGALLGGLAVLGALELQALRTPLKSLSEEIVRLRQTSASDKMPDDWRKEAQSEPLPRREFEAPPQRENRLPVSVTTAITTPALLPLRGVREFLMGGNTVVRVGIVILFFGTACLLRYLAEHTRVRPRSCASMGACHPRRSRRSRSCG